MHKTYAGAISLFNDFLRDDYVAAVFWNPGPEVFITNDPPSALKRVMAYYWGEVYDYQPRAFGGHDGRRVIRYPGSRPNPDFTQAGLSFTWTPDDPDFPLYLYLADTSYLGGGDYSALLAIWQALTVEEFMVRASPER